jgi:hypothetical protein
MADKDYQELVEFLGKQFEDIHKQFEGVHKRLDNTATKDDLADSMRHTGVLIEAVEHKLDIVVEGVMGINEKMAREKKEHEAEHGRLEKMSLINTADISGLDQRVGRLEKA